MEQNERGLVSLSRAECLELLESHDIGRVVFTERALPAVLPVSYALMDQDVMIRTREGSSVARAVRNGVLAFEVDEIDRSTRTGWSVVLTGTPVVVQDLESLMRTAELLHSLLTDRTDVIIRIPSTVLTGRRIVAARPKPLVRPGTMAV